ncbi:restriction endonuclease subunit S [Maribacter polysaccharolyticus]|uniref:restriction endonuclease subunit S n=1 Tax=Maribacter polysaccharolyticus TaxID=3020831 RepID=UPI00237F158C|nr:restriction endonuclease subunit S [Maribacter polysaccharolyticus]MDE3740209.1 restriction endonuclease subunit S [Maribacter polysaccharolyticus]
MELKGSWKEINLGKSATLKARIGWQGLTTAEYLSSGDYFLVTGTDFLNGFIDWNNCVHVEKERYDQDKYIQLQVDDILVTKDGTIGKVAIVDKIVKPTTLNSGVFVVRPFGKSFYSKYLFYILRSGHFADFLSKLTAGSTINHLYQKDFIHYTFPAPPTLKEQKLIADILTDSDILIQNLKNLISKKKAIKQGAMQELLTGKKRLKGFDDKWVERRLGDFLIYEQPTNYIVSSTEYNDNYETPVLTAGKSFILGRTNEKTGIFKDLPVIIFDDFTTATKFVRFPFKVKSSAMKILKKKNEDISLRFIYEVIQLIEYPLGDHKRHWIGEFQHLTIKTPKIEEQKAIAQILSDMDAEIEVLEIQLQKAQNIKQGMMQELLTGKNRLVKPVSQSSNNNIDKNVLKAAEPKAEYKIKLR